MRTTNFFAGVGWGEGATLLYDVTELASRGVILYVLHRISFRSARATSGGAAVKYITNGCVHIVHSLI